MTSPEELIKKLQLDAHPEGGWYRETYRSKQCFTGDGIFPEGRSHCTSIYFLISASSFSALHRIKSDETWHFYDGDPLEIVEIDKHGRLIQTVLGNGVYQYTVPAGNWFGSRVYANGHWSLTGCTVSPGFDFKDFEMADRNTLLNSFPNHSTVIQQFTR
ncbi:MAG: cupin domain-containing protein [Bacteroidota bacterium]